MIVARIVPLAGFAALGILSRAKDLLSQETVGELKWLIVHVLLPGVLFRTYLFTRLTPGLAAGAASLVGTLL